MIRHVYTLRIEADTEDILMAKLKEEADGIHIWLNKDAMAIPQGFSSGCNAKDSNTHMTYRYGEMNPTIGYAIGHGGGPIVAGGKQ